MHNLLNPQLKKEREPSDENQEVVFTIRPNPEAAPETIIIKVSKIINQSPLKENKYKRENKETSRANKIVNVPPRQVKNNNKAERTKKNNIN